MDLATPIHYLSLPLGFLFLLFLTRHLWFIGDIFDFFGRMQAACVPLIPGRGACGGMTAFSLMLPHNEHWSTIPILITFLLYKLVGLYSYVPYMAVELATHVVATNLLWRWMRRLGADPWVATGLATVFLFLGAGAEDIEWSFQMAWMLSIDLGLIGLYLVDVDGPSTWGRDAGYWALAVAACMCSGIGVCMVFLGASVALLRRGWQAMLRTAAVPGAAYLIWLVWVATAAPSLLSTSPATGSQLLQVPLYVGTGLVSAIANTFSPSGLGETLSAGLGGALAVGLGVWLVRNRGLARGPAALALAAPVVAALFFAIVGVGRVSLGVAEAGASRYAYLWVLLLLPATAVALTQLVRRWSASRWVVVGLAAALTLNGAAVLTTYADANAVLQTQERGEILGAAHLLADGAPLAVGGEGLVEPMHSSNLTVAALRSMIAAGRIPMHTPISATDTIDAALYLQVAVGSTPPAGVPGDAPRLEGTMVPSPPPGGASCVELADGSPLQLTFSTPSWISVRPTVSGKLSIQLAWQGDSRDLTAPRAFPVSGDGTAYLHITAAGSSALISLPAAATVCGVEG